MDPPYDSRQIANSLIKISNERGVPMSIMRVLKLAYMAHGWALAIFDAWSTIMFRRGDTGRLSQASTIRSVRSIRPQPDSACSRERY